MADLESSEFGGSSGLIEPPPHTLSAAETAMVERSIDPSDAGTSVEQKALEFMADGGKTPKGVPTE
jgi:hypothetical protein